MTYKRLGDYIREVNVRNRELKVTKLVGLTIDKAFIPSVANVIGTDLSNYKVIQREQFACSLMQVSPDGRSQLQVQLLLKFSFYQFHGANLQNKEAGSKGYQNYSEIIFSCKNVSDVFSIT